MHEVLREYAGVLTTFTASSAERGPVAIISGNRPCALMERQSVRYAAYDGRLDDLEAENSAPPAFMLLVSSNGSVITDWQGAG